ncbi:MAG: site-specific integrase [Chitinophagaceae bacterium]|nr:site-specific integrase [Chitinophagaceae bacterium]
MAAKVSLKYYLLSTRTTKGELPIYLRITLDRKKAELHTGYVSTTKDWNQEEQLTKSNHLVNQELVKRKAKVYELIIDLEKKNKPVSAAILKELLTGKQKVNIGLLAYFQQHIEEIKIRNEIKKISLNKYHQSFKSLNEFLAKMYKSQDIYIDQVDYSFINAYDLFLKEEYDLHKNTINKYHSRLRTILLKALAEGHIFKQPYANFKLNTVKTDREFLSQEEIDLLLKLDLSHNQSLDKVKDLFLFSVYTGLRFQDAQDLTMNNLSAYKNKPSIKFIQQKTSRAIEIPLLPQAKKIIDKYKGSPERKVLNKLLPKISNQKVNSYLKVIGDLAGIKRSITHHVARHTFATTICLNNNMPLEDVSMLLGHSSIKTTQIYGKITQQRIFDSIQKIQISKLKSTK